MKKICVALGVLFMAIASAFADENELVKTASSISTKSSGEISTDSIYWTFPGSIGLNVNQRVFHSDAPNPVSLWQIHGYETDREGLLHDILNKFSSYVNQNVKERYVAKLYRRKGFHPYCDKEGAFMAELKDVEDDGHLLLSDESGRERRYAFKEVSFIL